MSREWAHWRGDYEISSDGRLRTRKYLRMILPAAYRGRIPRYEITDRGENVSRQISSIVKEVFGFEVAFSEEDVAAIRAEAAEHNSTKRKWSDYAEERARKNKEAKLRAQTVEATPSEIKMPPLKSDCPFPTMRPQPSGYVTFDDPQVDPFGAGTWWVRLEMKMTTKQEQKVA